MTNGKRHVITLSGNEQDRGKPNLTLSPSPLWSRARDITASFRRVSAMRLYLACIAASVIAVVVGVIFVGWGIGNAWIVAGLALVAALAERGRVELGSKLE